MTDSGVRGKVASFVAYHWHLPALYLLFLAVGMAVRAPYRDAFFWADDIKFLREIGLIQTGNLSFWRYLFVPEFAKHSLPLGKLIFFLEWRYFGLATADWRLITELTHACSALLLFQLMRFYGARSIGALIGAIAWSGAAIGGVDNPLSWLMCFHWALSLMFTLSAMVAITKLAEHARLVPWLVFLFCGGTLLAGVATFPTLLALPAQFLTMRRFVTPAIPAGSLRRALIAFLSAGVTFGAPQILILAVCNYSHGRALHTPYQVIQQTTAQSITALATLVYDYPPIMPLISGDITAGESHCRDLFEKVSQDEPTTARLLFPHQFARLNERLGTQMAEGPRGEFRSFVLPGLFALALLLATCLLCSAPQRLLLGLAFGMAICQSLLINLGSTGSNLWENISYTHYMFFATVPWCVCLGMLADALVRGLVRLGAGWLGILCFVPLGFESIHQRNVAEDGRQMFDAAASTDIILHHWVMQSLERIRHDQLASRYVLRLPDLHVGVTNLTEEHFPLSAYVALTFPEGIRNVEVVGCRHLSPAQWQTAMRALMRVGGPSAKYWAAIVGNQRELTQYVDWLIVLAIAQSKSLSVPNLVFADSITVNLDSFLKLSYGTSTELLQIVPPESLREEQLQDLLKRLQGPPHPARQWWNDQIERLLRERPNGGVK